LACLSLTTAVHRPACPRAFATAMSPRPFALPAPPWRPASRLRPNKVCEVEVRNVQRTTNPQFNLAVVAPYERSPERPNWYKGVKQTCTGTGTFVLVGVNSGGGGWWG